MKPGLFLWIPAVIFLWVFGSVGAVHAQEIMPKSSLPPAGQALDKAPGEVVLVFAQELVLQGSDLQVFDAGGKQVDTGGGGFDYNDPQHTTLRVKLNPLPEGVYTVKWRIKLLTGRSTSGVYHFGVGKVQVPADSPDDDGLSEEQPAGNPKPVDTGFWTSPWVWAVALILLLGMLGVVFMFWRRKQSTTRR
jgi:methionine-rich copper-binding protein CopC